MNPHHLSDGRTRAGRAVLCALLLSFASALPASALLNLTANNKLIVDQGAAATITADYLAASCPGKLAPDIKFTVGPMTNGGPPHAGWLRNNGTNLVSGSSFTQDDINQGRVIYQHDDGNATTDDFQFDVSAPGETTIPGPPYMTYSFSIQVNLVNHAPVAGQGIGSTPYATQYTGTFPATDRDAPTNLTFRIVTNGRKGTAVVTAPNTGLFVYTPKPGERGTDVIAFQVNDGEFDSVDAGTFTITLKPAAFSTTYQVLESAPLCGMLSATNAVAPHTLNYCVLSNPPNGTVTIKDANTGAFVYSPKPGFSGQDAFSFVVNDGFIDSEPATCTLQVQRIIEPGDFFITEMSNGMVVYVDRKTSEFAVVTAGQNLKAPKACAVSRKGDLLVIDGVGGVVRVNPVTGAQTVLCPGTNFSSGTFAAFGIAEEAGGTILVADGPNGLMRVAADTGAITNLAHGGNLLLTLGVAVAATGDIYAADASGLANTPQPSSILRINPTNGAQTVICATNLALPVGIAVETDETLLVSDAGGFVGSPNRVVRINTRTGAQEIVSQEGNLSVPVGMGIDDLGKILVVSQNKDVVVEVDPASGAQTTLLGAPASATLLGLAVAREAGLPDSDHDGLPDWWEQRWFPYVDANAADDPDKDGAANECECKAGTDPVDPSSVLKLSARPIPGDKLFLEWSSVAGRFYVLERATGPSLAAAAFTPIQSGIKATPPINGVVDSETGSGQTFYYRLKLEE